MTEDGSFSGLRRARRKTSTGVIVARMLLPCGVALIHVALNSEELATRHGLVALSCVLLWYLSIELRGLWRAERRLFWVNPVVVASMVTFMLSFGATNVVYFLPDAVLETVGLLSYATPWMNQLMALVVLAAWAMWLGYSSRLGRRIGGALALSAVLRKTLRRRAHVNQPAVWVFVALSLVARLVKIKAGLYGYSAAHEQVIEGAGYTQYLAVMESLGVLALVVVAIDYFSARRMSIGHDRPRGGRLVWFLLGYEVAFGLLSGFKSAVVMPLLVVGVVYYARLQRLPRWLFPAIAAGVLVAYAVVEPFRRVRNEDNSFSGRSVDRIATAMVGAATAADDATESVPVGLQILARTNLTHIGSLGIEFAATKEFPSDSPDFLGDILLAPVHAVIPRFLWGGKPMQTIGLWYTQKIVGLDIMSSTGMSPFTYLYFAGGPLAIVIAFALLGCVQRGVFDGLPWHGDGGLVVLLGLLSTLGNIDSAFNAVIIGVVRMFPMLVVAQLLLLRNCRRCASSEFVSMQLASRRKAWA